jgi:hypothetical protein
LFPRFRRLAEADAAVLHVIGESLLVGHLRARLARSAVGDLFVELRRDPALDYSERPGVPLERGNARRS